MEKRRKRKSEIRSGYSVGGGEGRGEFGGPDSAEAEVKDQSSGELWARSVETEVKAELSESLGHVAS